MICICETRPSNESGQCINGQRDNSKIYQHKPTIISDKQVRHECPLTKYVLLKQFQFILLIGQKRQLSCVLLGQLF